MDSVKEWQKLVSLQVDQVYVADRVIVFDEDEEDDSDAAANASTQANFPAASLTKEEESPSTDSETKQPSHHNASFSLLKQASTNAMLASGNLSGTSTSNALTPNLDDSSTTHTPKLDEVSDVEMERTEDDEADEEANNEVLRALRERNPHLVKDPESTAETPASDEEDEAQQGTQLMPGLDVLTAMSTAPSTSFPAPAMHGPPQL
ncbi:hypothetical protein BZG36_01933 [Bifiguratus adelaidae]|uniref:Uncharacterized protein n=1 Tax=Bifiguratus adelaidae TaxID=1938954 RepID=A0A261Y3S4_9FUNG|nr:hypothetical protein BZG36_01933 [Bifiguratus adelaidae]